MAEILQERLIDASVEDVASMLTAPGSWLASAAEDAGTQGQSVYSDLRADVGRKKVGGQIRKRVLFRVGTPQRLREKTILPVTWEAVGFAGLFPVMDALIELHPAGRDRTRSVFWGRYDPPLGRTGDLVDRLVAHRVAEATVRGLLEAVAARVSEAPKSVPTGS